GVRTNRAGAAFLLYEECGPPRGVCGVGGLMRTLAVMLVMFTAAAAAVFAPFQLDWLTRHSETLAPSRVGTGFATPADLLEVTSTLAGVVLEDRQGALHLEQIRSEEHTSELQSRGQLVCRLLLEKKKGRNKPLTP